MEGVPRAVHEPNHIALAEGELAWGRGFAIIKSGVSVQGYQSVQNAHKAAI